MILTDFNTLLNYTSEVFQSKSLQTKLSFNLKKLNLKKLNRMGSRDGAGEQGWRRGSRDGAGGAGMAQGERGWRRGSGDGAGGAGMAQGERGWRSGESTRLPPMWPGFDSRSRRHMWVEFVVGSHPCSEGFSPGTPTVFLPLQKPTFPNSNSIWKQWSKSHSVDSTVIPIYFIYL